VCAVLSFAAKSTPISIGFGIYGASASISEMESSELLSTDKPVHIDDTVA
jgi:hypothetical protein